MTPRERVKAVEERLKARGVKDVKFTWNHEALAKNTPNQVFTDVAIALEAYLDGKCKLAEFNDREAYLDGKGAPAEFNDRQAGSVLPQ